MKKVLITDDVHEILIHGLEKAGYEVNYLPHINLEETLSIITDYEGIIINSKIKIDHSFLDKAKRLQFIARLGSGMEVVDLEEAKKRGIFVHRSPDGNADSVAEHAIGMLLSLFNKLNSCHRSVESYQWNRESNRGLEMKGKTISIIGCGFTGSALVKKLIGFEMNILIYDKYKTLEHFTHAKQVELEAVFQDTDILSIHLPLTVETRKMINASFFNQFRKEFFLINTSRGEVIEEADLLLGLNAGKIKGACLDVFEKEKTNLYTDKDIEFYNELFRRQNIVLSPHVAGWTNESKKRHAEILLNRICNNSDYV